MVVEQVLLVTVLLFQSTDQCTIALFSRWQSVQERLESRLVVYGGLEEGVLVAQDQIQLVDVHEKVFSKTEVVVQCAMKLRYASSLLNE